MSASFNSKFRESNGEYVKAGVKNAYKQDWDTRTNAPPSLEGTRYNRYGARESGIGSILDSEIVKRNLDREKENLGDGFVQLQIVDADKQKKPLNIGGRLHYADDTGKFTIIDEKYLEIMKQRETEKREYIEGIIQTAIMSDEVCATILGTNEEGLYKQLGPKGGVEYGLTEPDLVAVDARPSAIETYAESSQAYANAVQKFKKCIKQKMPIISSLTPAKALNES